MSDSIAYGGQLYGSRNLYRFAPTVITGSAPPPAIYDPAVLSLSGWWRDYNGAPWIGTASAGTSGDAGKSFDTAGVDPTVGSIGLYTYANFSGAGKALLATTLTMEDLFTSTEYTQVYLVYMYTLPASAGESTPYSDIPILADTGGGAYYGSSLSTSGFTGYHLDSTVSYKGARVALPTGNTGFWMMLTSRFDGAILKSSANLGTEATQTKLASLGLGPAPVKLGRDIFNVDTFDGRIAEIITAKTYLSDTDLANIKSYFNGRYTLAL